MIYISLQRNLRVTFIILLLACSLHSYGNDSVQHYKRLQIDVLMDTFHDVRKANLINRNHTDDDVQITWHKFNPIEKYSYLQTVFPRLKEAESYIVINNSWNLRLNSTLLKRHIDTATDKFDVSALSLASSVTTCLFHKINNRGNKIIMAVVKQQKWSHVILIYDQENGKETEELMDLLKENSVVFSLYASDDILNESTDSVLKLYHAFSDDGVNVALLCSINIVQQILHLMNIFDHIESNKHVTAMRMKSRWLIKTTVINPDVDIIPYAYDLDNVAVISDVHPSSTKGPLIFNLAYLKEISLGIQYDNDSVTMSLDASTLNTLVHDMDVWCNINSNKQIFNAYSLYWTSLKGRMNTLNEGNYQTKRKFRKLCTCFSNESCIKMDVFPNDNYGFNGREFLVTTQLWPPYVSKTSTQGKDNYSGFVMDMLRDMALSLNFSYTIVQPMDGEWGSPDSNGNWSGMIGQLHKKEVDMMVAPTSISKEREEVMDFTHPYTHDFSTVGIKLPDPSKNKWKTFISPLDVTVHYCIWAMLFGVTLILYVIERFSPTYYGDNNGYKRTYQNSFWYLFGALLTQGGDRLPEAQSARALISCWWIFSIVMVAVYSGNLIAFLTIPKNHLPFNTLEEMAAQTQYKWGTVDGTIWASKWKESELPTNRALWAGVVKFNKTDPTVLALKAADHLKKVVEEGNYAYYADATLLDVYRSTDCRLVTIGERINDMQYGFGLPNHSPYTDMFSNKILQMTEGGIVRHLKHKYIPNLDACNAEKTPTAKSIDIVDIQSGFYVLTIGICFGSTILICECVLVRVIKPIIRKQKR